MTWEITLLCVLIAVIVVGINGVTSRLRLIAARQGRLSLTFQKIEIDLDALQSSLLALAAKDPEVLERLRNINDARALTFRHVIEQGPRSSEILRGLEWPDPSDDPVFWRDTPLADRMKLPRSLSDIREKGINP